MMTEANRKQAPGLWPALQDATQSLFENGTGHISRELPLGELALSGLDIDQRAMAMRRAGSPGMPENADAVLAVEQTELPIGELALSGLDIDQRALHLGMTGRKTH
jgi:hypothetical protein